MSAKYLKNFFASINFLNAKVSNRHEVDRIIENEITYKLADDLIQSIEKKFHVDLERSLEMILTKIHLLLQNGTHSVQDKLLELQAAFDDIKAKAPAKIDSCLQHRDDEMTSLSEKALHQMVVCGYALIGQDPILAVNKIHTLKNMISEEVKSMNAQKKGIYELLRVCGHEHDSLKKVVKCVISKSPPIKSVLMSVTGKLTNGIVELTKTLARGAMHEACLIEVLRSAEEEAAQILVDIKQCVYNDTALGRNENQPLVKEIDEADYSLLNALKVKEEVENKGNINVTKGNDVRFKSKSNVLLVDVKNDLNSLNTDPLPKNID